MLWHQGTLYAFHVFLPTWVLDWMSVTNYKICADTDPPEKAAFPTREGTAGLEVEPGKAVPVLSTKTVSLISKKCRFIWMWLLVCSSMLTVKSTVAARPPGLEWVLSVAWWNLWRLSLCYSYGISLHVSRTPTIQTSNEGRLTFLLLQQLPMHVFAGLGSWLQAGAEEWGGIGARGFSCCLTDLLNCVWGSD